MLLSIKYKVNRIIQSCNSARSTDSFSELSNLINPAKKELKKFNTLKWYKMDDDKKLNLIRYIKNNQNNQNNQVLNLLKNHKKFNTIISSISSYNAHENSVNSFLNLESDENFIHVLKFMENIKSKDFLGSIVDTIYRCISRENSVLEPINLNIFNPSNTEYKFLLSFLSKMASVLDTNNQSVHGFFCEVLIECSRDEIVKAFNESDDDFVDLLITFIKKNKRILTYRSSNEADLITDKFRFTVSRCRGVRVMECSITTATEAAEEARIKQRATERAAEAEAEAEERDRNELLFFVTDLGTGRGLNRYHLSVGNSNINNEAANATIDESLYEITKSPDSDFCTSNKHIFADHVNIYDKSTIEINNHTYATCVDFINKIQEDPSSVIDKDTANNLLNLINGAHDINSIDGLQVINIITISLYKRVYNSTHNRKEPRKEFNELLNNKITQINHKIDITIYASIYGIDSNFDLESLRHKLKQFISTDK